MATGLSEVRSSLIATLVAVMIAEQRNPPVHQNRDHAATVTRLPIVRLAQLRVRTEDHATMLAGPQTAPLIVSQRDADAMIAVAMRKLRRHLAPIVQPPQTETPATTGVVVRNDRLAMNRRAETLLHAVVTANAMSRM